MDLAGFEFRVDELDGCRVLETIYPPSIDVAKLSVTIARYFDLWDEGGDTPTVSLQNLSRLEGFTDEVRNVLKSVIQRTVLQPSFVAGAWYTDGNHAIYDEIMRVRRAAGRSTDDVYDTRAEAVAFLRATIRARLGRRTR
jgi:hypothetical protein